MKTNKTNPAARGHVGNGGLGDVGGLATLITLEGRWEAHARRHTCLLCWNVGESPVHQIVNNGTCCLIRTRLRRLLVTCAHVWSGFEEFRRSQNGAQLWISLVDDDQPSSPSRPRPLPNPQLIAKDDGLDLATIVFDTIDALDARRFCYLRSSDEPRVRRGDIVHFLGYPGDAVRAGNPGLTLNYCFTSRDVHDVGRTQFVLHERTGGIHHTNKHGEPTSAFRAGGESGAPVFKIRQNFELELAGIVSRLCSSGLASGEARPYEMSDGDVFATHTCFIQDDGSIARP